MNETKKNRNFQPRGEKTVNCPYCWAPNKVESKEDFKVENFQLVTSHPPIKHYSNGFSEVKVPWWRFWAMKIPKRVMVGRLKCKSKKCGQYFVVALWPNDSKEANSQLPSAKKSLLFRFKDLFGSIFHPILNWWTASIMHNLFPFST